MGNCLCLGQEYAHRITAQGAPVAEKPFSITNEMVAVLIAESSRTQPSRRIAVTAGKVDLSGFTKVKHAKSEEVANFLARSLRETTFFDYDDEVLRDLSEQMFDRDVEEGEEIIREGDEGDRLYIVGTGEFEAFVSTSTDSKGRYEAGAMFGELAVLYQTPRAATIRCAASGTLWALDRHSFRGTVTQSHLASTSEFLKAVDILDCLSDEQRHVLAAHMEVKIFKDGEYIVRQGEIADALYFIKAGAASVHLNAPHKPNDGTGILLRLHTGQFFGENAINHTVPLSARSLRASDVPEDQKRSANVVAHGRVVALQLLSTDFHALIGDVAASLARSFAKKLVSSIPMFHPLSAEAHEEFADTLQVVRHVRNEILIEQGEINDTLFIVKAGFVALRQNGVNLEKLGPSGIFGECELLESTRGKPSRYEAVALTEQVVLYVVSAGTISALISDNEDVNSLIEDEITLRDGITPSSRIHFDQLEQLRTIGIGTFGRVKLVKHAKSSSPYALKIIDKRQVVHMKQESHLMQEKNLLALCQHPFIIRLISTFQDEDHLYMLLELCLGGELFSRLQKSGPMREDAARFYAGCVVSAFCYLHQRRIAYRDLKPENLLLDAKGYIKLVDFGFAKQILDHRTLTLCGTPEYLAPEIILNKSHDIGVDWWTCGILIYELISGRPPFQDADPMKLYGKISNGTFRMSPRFSDDVRALLTKLIEVDPEKRIGASTCGKEVKEQPWFSHINFEKLEARSMQAPFIPQISNPFDDSNFDFYDENDTKTAFRTVKLPAGAFDAF